MLYRVDKSNYHMFDDMIFYRGHGRYKNNDEAAESQDFTAYYSALEVQTFYAFAVQSEDKFIGYILLNYLPKIGSASGRGWLFVDDLRVNPDYRRKGTARLLMNKADALSKELNASGLRLYVNADNPGGIAFYKTCGYEQKFGTSMLMQREC
ncbi:MAG: GNAT family N-acetyltransferase [Defluviitaleaceae bacterium]|nr:GNAT family N-acetyltransferase [Defluviitaleaceae bacterium]